MSERPENEDVFLCPGCGQECDPTVCWCGEEKFSGEHSVSHSFVPMGCDCGRNLDDR